ncbi:MAG: CHAD domain-containing protein [Gemmatimonadota bacterium]|nr:CHAD domain-containing protein [Gemmatimonadota bacterium]
MSYRLSPSETVGEGLRRILIEEVDAAVGYTRDPEMDVHEAVHQLRKRMKGARALVQLVRGSLPERRKENQRYRDIGRHVSEARDAASIVEAFNVMLDELPLDRATALEPVHEALRERREALTATLQIRDRLAWCGGELLKAPPATNRLRLRSDGWEAIEYGLRHWYRRGRRLWRRAAEEATTELLHEWRKCAKYHLYHLRLLADIDPGAMQWRLDRTGALEDLLGDEHDLAVLETVLPELAVTVSARQAGQRELGLRRARLQETAIAGGADVYRASPKKFLNELEAAWRSWRDSASPAVHPIE